MRDNRPRQRSSYHNRNACSCYSFPLHTITSSISIVQPVPVPVPVLNSSAVPIHGDTTRTQVLKDGRSKAMQSERLLEENSGHFVVGPSNPTQVFNISSKLQSRLSKSIYLTLKLTYSYFKMLGNY